MRRVGQASITVEEAVAEMVNMDYIPANFTLLEMLAAFQEEAEVEYENARIERIPEEQMIALEIHMQACRGRYALAQFLLESLQYEVDHQEGSMIILADESFGKQRLTFESVSGWAAEKYGIGISRVTQNAIKVDLKDGRWEDVTIKIWANYKIGYSVKGGNYSRSHFRKIGLMGKAKNIPNHLGGILIVLSQRKPFPAERCQAADKTKISKLRRALHEWIGLPEDPFLPYNQHDGWIPRFRLVDDRNNADNRAKEKAIHASFDDSQSHDIDDD